MNNEQINNFLKVVETGSITKTAQELFISPQALHQQLDRIEGEIGVKLLIRSKRGVKLTKAGKVFFVGFKDLKPKYEEIINKTKKTVEETEHTIVSLSSGSFCDFHFNQIIADYRKNHPDIHLQYLMAKTENRKTDFALNDVMIKNLHHYVVLDKMQIFAIFAANHPLKNRKKLRWTDLNKFSLIIKSPFLLNHLLPEFWNKISKSHWQENKNPVMTYSLLQNKPYVINLTYGYPHIGNVDRPNAYLCVPVKNTKFEERLYYADNLPSFKKEYLRAVLKGHRKNLS